MALSKKPTGHWESIDFSFVLFTVHLFHHLLFWYYVETYCILQMVLDICITSYIFAVTVSRFWQESPQQTFNVAEESTKAHIKEEAGVNNSSK